MEFYSLYFDRCCVIILFCSRDLYNIGYLICFSHTLLPLGEVIFTEFLSPTDVPHRLVDSGGSSWY